MHTYTKEIRKFCSKTARKISDNLPPTVPLILNYNINIFDEIPELMHEISGGEGFIVKELASPVLIYYKLQDRELKELLVPGVFVQRFHHTLVDGVPKDTADYVESQVKMILTRAQISDNLNGIPLTKNLEAASILEELDFDDRLSGVIEDYLSKNLNKGERIESFEQLVCFYPELDALTYIDKAALDLLSYSSIGRLMAQSSKSKDENKAKTSVPKIDASTISRILSVASTANGVIPPAPKMTETKQEQMPSKPADDKMGLLATIFDNYMYQTKEVFSIISSSNRPKPLKLHEVLYSCKEKTTVENLAYNEATDPISRTASSLQNARSVGNPNRNLPIFPSDVMEHILLGNFPFMLIYAKSIDKSNLVNDPLYHIKRYMIEQAINCMETLKAQPSSSFSVDEAYVIKGSDSIANKKLINRLYLSSTKPDKTGIPTEVPFNNPYEIYFIDYSLMNAYLKCKKIKYNNNLNQFLNFISPINIED